MQALACVRLPFLHILDDKSPEEHAFFWPGLPDPLPGYWQPENLPFTPNEAQLLLAEFRMLGTPDLEALRLTVSQGSIIESLRSTDELNAIASFAGRGPKKSAIALLKEQAHKILLWRWCLEEIQLEIGKLEYECATAEKAIPGFFSGQIPKADSDCACRFPMNELREVLAQSWATCVLNAIFFIPESVPIYIEKEMMPHILDQPCLETTRWSYETGGLGKLTAPVWRLLGQKAPSASGYAELDSLYNAERTWIGRI